MFPRARRQRTVGFTLVELLVVIAIIGILVALLLPAIQAAREAARRTQCQTNLHNLALGVLNYHDAQKSFPYAIYIPSNANGDPIIRTRDPLLGPAALLYANWAIQILPYIEEQALYDSFVMYDEPSPGSGSSAPSLAALNHFDNKIPRGTELQYMLCPSDRGRETRFGDGVPPLSGGNWARGNYGLNLGLGYTVDHLIKDEIYPWNQPCGRGVAGINRGAKIPQIEDGTTKTIMLGEIRIGLSARDRRGTWAMPMVGSNIIAEQASNCANGPNDCEGGTDDLTDGDKVIADMGEENLLAECMMPSDYYYSVSSVVRSTHPGGVHAAMCDGSVRFISDNVQASRPCPGYRDFCKDDISQFGIWQRLNSSNDGFIIDDSSF